MKILLVEDEKVLSNSLRQVLEALHYEVTQAYDGLEAVNLCNDKTFDLIIMDIMMPKMNGIEATKKIRAMGKDTPIIMLTAKGEVEDKVDGLDSGADDYLSKPFEIKELLARIRALLRRGEKLIDNTKFHDLTLNPNVYLIKCCSKQVYLTKKEFMLLEYFIRHQDRYSSTETILEDLWGNDKDVDITVVWVFISNLRKKLESICSKIIIEVARGRGYRINVQKV